jgi:hypothetical protein
MFTRSADANLDGTHLHDIVRNVTTQQLSALFGPPTPGYDPEKGYEHEFHFAGPGDEVVNLYDRYGVYRIGATNAATAELFREWLAVLAAGKSD